MPWKTVGIYRSLDPLGLRIHGLGPTALSALGLGAFFLCNLEPGRRRRHGRMEGDAEAQKIVFEAQ